MLLTRVSLCVIGWFSGFVVRVCVLVCGNPRVAHGLRPQVATRSHVEDNEMCKAPPPTSTCTCA